MMKYYTLKELDEYWACMKVCLIVILLAWIINKLEKLVKR